MSDRGLITIGILVLALTACSLVAIFAPRTRRIFWIAGLSLALLEFGGITAGVTFSVISHRHLSSKGLMALLANGYGTWVIARYLLEKIREPKLDRLLDSN